MPRQCWAAALAVALSAAWAGPSSAQESTAGLTGTVRDSDGVTLGGTAITALDRASGFRYRTVASDGGAYWLEGLPAGRYDVTASRIGYGTVTQRSAELRVGTTSTLDFTLRDAAIELETLRVDRPLLETTRADVSFTIDHELIAQLPDASRRFTDIALFAPGTTPMSNGPAGAESTVAVGALNNRSTSIMVDGGSLNEPGGLVAFNSMPRLAVDEVQVLTTGYGAEFGQAASGTINATTRRGTNDWTSEGFALFRDRSLSATDAFAIEDPSFSRGLFGFALGGPIRRNRTHIFVAAEITDEMTAGIVNTGGQYPEFDGDYDLPANEQLVLVRLDQQAGDAHELMLRYSGGFRTERTSIGAPSFCLFFGGAPIASPNFGLDQDLAVHSVLARHRWSVGQRSVNQASLHFYRTSSDWRRLQDAPTLAYPSICDGGNYFDLDKTATRFEARNAFSFALSGGAGEHRLKVGGRLTVAGNDEELGTFANGIFRFEEDNSTEPFTFGRGQGIVGDEVNTQVGLFVQDEWRPIAELTLNLGLRYDVETNGSNQGFVGPGADELDFVSSTPRSIDADNIAPRVALAWDAAESGHTVVRGGFGVFYDQQWLWRSAFEPGLRGFDILNPGTLDPSEIEESDKIFDTTIFPLDSVMRAPFTRQFSVGIEQLLPGEAVLRVDGLVVQGRNLSLTIQRNPLSFDEGGNPVRNVHPEWGEILQRQNVGRAESQMLMVQLLKDAQVWGASVAYTLASRRTTVDDWFQRVALRDTIDNFFAAEGPASWDERHRLVLAGWAQTPLGPLVGLRTIYASARPFSAFDALGRVGRRNSRRGADFFVTDLSVSWPLPVGPADAGLVLNVYNLFNRTNFDPGSFVPRVDSDDFGQPTAAFPRRQVELGVQAWF